MTERLEQHEWDYLRTMMDCDGLEVPEHDWEFVQSLVDRELARWITGRRGPGRSFRRAVVAIESDDLVDLLPEKKPRQRIERRVSIRKQTKKWTTRDEGKVRICDMADTHLVNTINMLRRNAARDCARTALFYLTCPEPSGDGAMMCFESEQEHAFDATWEDHVHELHGPMMLDFERRGLDPSLLKEPPDGQEMAAVAGLKAVVDRMAKRSGIFPHPDREHRRNR